MKKYISPVAKSIVLDYEGFVAGSGGLGDGDSIENQKPKDDDDDNFMSNRRGIWGNTEW